MKFFMNKSIWSKIAILLIIVLLFQFVVTKPTLAKAEVGDTRIDFGGKLLSPVMSLVVSLADAMMDMMHSSIMGTNESLLPVDVDSKWWEILSKVLVIGAIVAAAIFVTIATFGAAATVGAVIGAIGTALWTALGAGVASIGAYFVLDNAFDQLKIKGKASAVSYTDDIELPRTLYLPAYTLSPEEIFEGKILLFNVDFFGKPKEIKKAETTTEDGNKTVNYYYYLKDTNKADIEDNRVKTSNQDVAADLQGNISKWYVQIRNIVLVCMMIVLLYIGIRILLTSLAGEKAKYKQFLQDWFVGLILIFFMHYIMTFAVTIVQKITDIVDTSVDSNTYVVKFPVDKDGKIVKFFNNNKMAYMIYDKNGKQITSDENGKVKEGDAAYVVYPTNVLGSLRLTLQLQSWGAGYIGYALAFVVLVLFTVFFIFTYLRRVLYMAFLTLIAPVVALTYPIDKMNDGSAQGFTKWFREYIFNLLIQPMHLMLYYILVTSAFDLAGKNIIYTLVAIGFMMPAEKLLRSFFGFEKAHTPGLLAGPAGAALTMQGLQTLSNLRSGKSKSKESSKGNAKPQVRQANNSNRLLNKLDGDVNPTSEMASLVGNAGEGKSVGAVNGKVGINDSQLGIDKDQAALDAMKDNDLNGEQNALNDMMLEDGIVTAGEVGALDNDQKAIDNLRDEMGDDPEAKAYLAEQQEDINKRRLELARRAGLEGEQANVSQNRIYQQPLLDAERDEINKRKAELSSDSIPTEKIDPIQQQREAVIRDAQAEAAEKISQDRAEIPKIKRVQSAVMRGAMKAPKVIGGASRVAGRYFATGAGVALGAAAGIVTGNPKQMLTYMGVGAATGNKIGAVSGENISNNLQSAGQVISDKYNKMLDKDDALRQIELEKEVKAQRKEYVSAMKESGFSKDETKEMVDNGIIDRYIKNNVNSQDAVVSEQMRRDDPKISQEQAIATAKYAKRVGEASKGPERKKWQEHFAGEFKDKANLNQEQANVAAEQTLKRVDAFNKYKKKLN